ncbi:MAG TPA: M2 family metallopeptidase [Candidatus Kapabacteria bacterium]|nr:M2 family metallopeptidase [Candidatus Kapabacteria bacterium]
MRDLKLFLVRLAVAAVLLCAESIRADTASEAAEFLRMFNEVGQPLFTAANEADWKASTDVTDENTGRRIGANDVRAKFVGSPYVIEKAKALLVRKSELDDKSVRQLESILLAAAGFPGTKPELVSARVSAEARQGAIQDGFKFEIADPKTKQKRAITPNQINEILDSSRDMAERRAAWESSKEIGVPLRPGLIELQKLRNQVAREMGFTSFFHLQVADYGMTVAEMRALTEQLNEELKPLYQQLHTWTKHKLAERYNQPVPKLIPAHWLGNRWSQQWPGLVEAANFDEHFKGRESKWLVEQAERFYVSLGWPKLPEVFWTKSDLYELPPDAPRKKNTHASAWHVDLNNDVRSLMSVRPNYDWHETTHHELGHIYYFLAYSNDEVPMTLREGANRAFHEAIGDLIGIAARQIPYLKQVEVLPKDVQIDKTQYLLNEALDSAIVFIPWSAGVMTAWEHDFYEENLSPNEYNKRWWEYVAKYQGVSAPESRDEKYCDPATKTHINDDPAQYYDYALAYIIKYQLHMHIAKNILKQDPHSCNYYGNKAVGDFLWNILRVGKTQDWRKLLREATGEEISAKPMLEYFAPVKAWLEKENAGRTIGW